MQAVKGMTTMTVDNHLTTILEYSHYPVSRAGDSTRVQYILYSTELLIQYEQRLVFKVQINQR